MSKEIYVRCLLTDKVKLSANKLNKHFKDTILKDLKAKVEGVCTKHGYIKQDSVEIHSIQCGQVEMASLTGNVIVEVKFYADICNPSVGNVIKCNVSNINKFGILAEVKPILEVIIAKNSVNIKSDVDLSTIQVGDEIFVEVVGKKYELMDKRISIIGRVVTSPQSAKYKKTTRTYVQPDMTEIEENDDDDDVIIGEDEDDENSEDEEKEDGSDVESEKEESDDVDVDAYEGESDDDEKGKKIGGAEFFESDGEYDMFDGDDGASASEEEEEAEEDDF